MGLSIRCSVTLTTVISALHWGPQRKPNEMFAMGRAEAPYLQIVPLSKEVAHIN